MFYFHEASPREKLDRALRVLRFLSDSMTKRDLLAVIERLVLELEEEE